MVPQERTLCPHLDVVENIVLGIEPATNIARVAEEERGIPTLCEFFGAEMAEQLGAEGRRADVIHANNVLAHVADLPVPKVHFGVGTGELLGAMHRVGADVVGIDYRLALDEGIRRLGGTVPVQGNIDPALLAAPWPVLEAHVREVVERGGSAPAHIVNLGHGVSPDTDPAVLTRVVELVHSIGAQRS